MLSKRAVRTVATSRATPMRTLSPRLSLLFMMTLAGVMMMLARANAPLTTSARSTLTDIMVPVVSAVSAPAQAFRNVKDWVAEMAAMRSENVAMKAQVRQLLQWQALANDLRAENETLRNLMRVVPQNPAHAVAARIVSESGGPLFRVALINGGSDEGIASGQAVIGAEGLVGTVMEAGLSSSRVLLLTDINSRVPVIGEISRERSIASGSNSPLLSLSYVEAGTRLAVGERVLTSGDGGVFPPGIPVGVVTEISGGNVTIQPLADWTRTELVSVASFSL